MPPGVPSPSGRRFASPPGASSGAARRRNKFLKCPETPKFCQKRQACGVSGALQERRAGHYRRDPEALQELQVGCLARDGRRLPRHARYRRTQHTCAHPVDASYGPGDPNRRARGAENSDLWQFSTSGPWRLPTGCPSAPRRGARSPRPGHVWKASRRGSGAEIWRAGLPRAPAERLRDDAPKRSTRRRWTPGLALGAVGLGFRAGGADHRRGQLEVLGADRNVDPARAGGGRERASGALWRAAKVAPGAGRRARLWRGWAVRRGRGRRN